MPLARTTLNNPLFMRVRKAQEWSNWPIIKGLMACIMYKNKVKRSPQYINFYSFGVEQLAYNQGDV